MGIYFILGKLRLERILLPSQRMSRHESVSKIYIKVISSLMASISKFEYFLSGDGLFCFFPQTHDVVCLNSS